MEIFELKMTELSKLLQEKKISAYETARAQFARIREIEPKINAYISLEEEKAYRQAKAIDKRRMQGEKLSPLAGIPIGIKDNICIQGYKTTCASKMLENFVAPYDAHVIKRLKENGAVFCGKLNMDEFAMGSSTETSYFKVTHNPHHLGYVPGGSSGGSAAAVAAGECFGALGTDTGGSIRQPASFCGVVGLKPTYGRVSRYGAVAFASSLDQIGPMGRTVGDTALLFSGIYGHDPLDATSLEDLPKVEMPKDDFTFLKGLRIGLPKEYFGKHIRKDITLAVKKAAQLLEKEGAVIQEISFPDAEHALPAYYIISSAEASSNLARFDGVRYGYRSKNSQNIEDMYVNSRTEGFGEEVKRRILLGTFVLSSGYYDAYYKRAKILQQHLISQIHQLFSKADLILTPAAPDTAFKIHSEIEDPVKMALNDMCTVFANIAGLPAVSIPCAKDDEGLPIGMQLVAQKGMETQLLQTAHCYEMLYGSFEKIPEIKGEVKR